MKYEFRVGTSEPLDIQIAPIMADGTTQPSAGISVALVIDGRGGAEVPTPPTVAWLVQADWTVSISGLERLTVAGSPYRMRIHLTDSVGKIAFAPTGAYYDQLVVVEA